ncbi:unnamed protein product, partial [marine sediment metagenome]
MATDNLKLWSREDDENSDNNVPTGAPENVTTVDSLNNIMRAMMASTRSFFETPEWRDFGFIITAGPDPATQFRAQIQTGTGSSNFTGLYKVGQRAQITDGTIKYGTITDVVESSDVLVTLVMDGGVALSAPTIVKVSFDPTNTGGYDEASVKNYG